MTPEQLYREKQQVAVYRQHESERKNLVQPIKTVAQVALVLSALPTFAVGQWLIQILATGRSLSLAVDQTELTAFSITALVALGFLLLGVFIFGVLLGVASVVETLMMVRGPYGLRTVDTTPRPTSNPSPIPGEYLSREEALAEASKHGAVGTYLSQEEARDYASKHPTPPRSP